MSENTYFKEYMANQANNDMKRFTKQVNQLGEMVQNLQIGIEVMENANILKAIEIDSTFPENQRVFTKDEIHKCLRKVKSQYLGSQKNR